MTIKTNEELAAEIAAIREELNYHLLNSMIFSAFTKTVIDHFIKTTEETAVFTNLFEINLKLLEKDFYESQDPTQSTGN